MGDENPLGKSEVFQVERKMEHGGANHSPAPKATASGSAMANNAPKVAKKTIPPKAGEVAPNAVDAPKAAIAKNVPEAAKKAMAPKAAEVAPNAVDAPKAAAAHTKPAAAPKPAASYSSTYSSTAGAVVDKKNSSSELPAISSYLPVNASYGMADAKRQKVRGKQVLFCYFLFELCEM